MQACKTKGSVILLGTASCNLVCRRDSIHSMNDQCLDFVKE
jgi:hypothetical protein